ncbi:YrhC family protein [Alkalihalobacillus pseudalcaliphilus]|uniref:YrhC family protein n=1 Tax=Alkalihalobacillus pseudalcaliphilus TaxID=79884 RepID=UPI00064DD07B|nr:YrhC family protein [Alkalihalobacillus pseudalcaliphilus]KMK75755.1 hypothetical protein AB990_10795 [Alkalihalobacillus pseudalcaliphilus]
MSEKEMKELEGKVADFNRFRFILLSLSTILFLGVIVPVDGKLAWIPPLLISGVFLLIASALYCHFETMKATKKLMEKQN